LTGDRLKGRLSLKKPFISEKGTKNLTDNNAYA
jgi:hypothetical protein